MSLTTRGANVCELPAVPAVYYDVLPHALQGAHPLQHSHTVAVGRLYGSSLLHGSPDNSICPPSSHTVSDLQHRSAAKVCAAVATLQCVSFSTSEWPHPTYVSSLSFQAGQVSSSKPCDELVFHAANVGVHGVRGNVKAPF